MRRFAAALMLLMGCSRSEAPLVQESSSRTAHPPPAASVSAQPRADALAPLAATGWIEKLELEGQVAYVTPPLGARERRPVIVAVHGAGDRAEWACGGWRLACKGYAFVVCPQGRAVGGERFGWASSKEIAARIDVALRAVGARFGPYLHPGPKIYAGFSQGAILARPVLVEQPTPFPIAILAEGGYGFSSSAGFAREYHAAGGRRVLLVCGGAGCLAHARRAVTQLEGAGLSAHIAVDVKGGHNLNQRMQTALAKVWPGLVAGLDGWQGFGVQGAAAP